MFLSPQLLGSSVKPLCNAAPQSTDCVVGERGGERGERRGEGMCGERTSSTVSRSKGACVSKNLSLSRHRHQNKKAYWRCRLTMVTACSTHTHTHTDAHTHAHVHTFTHSLTGKRHTQSYTHLIFPCGLFHQVIRQ